MIRYNANALRPKHFEPPLGEPVPEPPPRKNQFNPHGKSAGALYRLIRTIAEKGELCPSSEELAERIGRNRSLIAELFRKLQREGVIHIQRAKRRRIVTIVETGQRTADPREVPHA